jgi:hypothetical protein
MDFPIQLIVGAVLIGWLVWRYFRKGPEKWL